MPTAFDRQIHKTLADPALKKHAIEHLDFYLEQLDANVVANGGKVIWCRDAKEVAGFVLQPAKEKCEN